MKFVLISKDGDFLPLLKRIENEGNEVVAYVDAEHPLYENMIPQVDNALELKLDKDDVIIFDMVGAGAAADRVGASMPNVLGGGSINDRIELDRKFGTDFMAKHGINTPPTWEFDTIDKTRKFVEEHPERYVFKPNGNLETDLTYVSSSAEDLLAVLPYLEERIPEGTEFELQQFVEGVEMSTEAWFNGERFLQPINSTMEEKKFMVGNVGPATGCMGNVVWSWDKKTSQFLYEYLFQPLEADLKKAGYLGPLDINGIWNGDGIHALEFTARFGYDAIQAYSRLIRMPLGEFLRDLRKLDKMPVSTSELALAVRVSIPPFPSDGDVPKVPVRGLDDPDKIYLSDVYFDKDLEMYRCAGSDGYILSVCANGPTVASCQAQAYPVIESLEIPNKQYRVDIGERYVHDRDEIAHIIRTVSRRRGS